MQTRARWATVAALGAVAGGAALLFWVLPALLGLAGGAVPQVATALSLAARPPVVLEVAGSETPLVGRSLHFERVTVAEQGSEQARAVSTLDFEGTLGSIRVSSLGRETTRFRRGPAGWELDGPLAPTLAAAVGTLVARRRALEDADASALAALVRPVDRNAAVTDPAVRALLARPPQRSVPQAWYLRFEVGEITVTEEEGPPSHARRLRLVPSAPGSLEFVFAGSLL
jgi:hypothetical protein